MDSLIHFEEYEEYIDESLIGEGYIYVFYYVFEYANWYVFFCIYVFMHSMSIIEITNSIVGQLKLKRNLVFHIVIVSFNI